MHFVERILFGAHGYQNNPNLVHTALKRTKSIESLCLKAIIKKKMNNSDEVQNKDNTLRTNMYQRYQ